MTASFFRLAAGLIIAALVPSIAQSQAPADPIIVEGTRNTAEQVRTFVDMLTPAPIRGQLARFVTDVCPSVIGLSQRQDQLVETRIRAFAAAAGISLAKHGCQTNALLIVVDHKKEILEQLWRSSADIFPASWSDSQLQAIIKDPSPVAAWHLEITMGSDGGDIGQANYSGIYHDNPRSVRVLRTTQRSPYIRPLVGRRTSGTVVMIERRALEGLTTTQLADYATMRLLVSNDPKQYRALDGATILNAVEAPIGTSVPLTATQWDLDFLTAFYKIRPDAYVEGQRTEIRRSMENALTSETHSSSVRP